MRNSLKLFAVRGIDIRLHATFPLILLWAAFQFGLITGTFEGAIFGVTAVSLLFVLVTLHELGHSFAAQRYGVPVKQIVLSPIGGVAQLNYIPENPRHEFVIAIAGPAVNFAIALVMLVVAGVANIAILDPLTTLFGGAGLTLSGLFSYVFVYNLFLALFNLLPAFPMDGGRILRAGLAMRLDYVQATKIAAAVGRGVAVLMGLYALFNGGIFLILIAVFVYMGARQEAVMVEQRSFLRRYQVWQAFSQTAYRLTPYTNLQQAANLMLASGQRSFPVVEGETLVGFMPQRILLAALRNRGAHTWVNMVMRQDVQPVTPTTNLFTVQERMAADQLDALPVISENGRYLGLITQQHLLDLRSLVRVAPKTLVDVQSA